MKMGMDREDAEAYLKRKGKATTPGEIEKVMKKGRIYGDPVAVCE